VLNCVFLITKIEILFYICLSLVYSLLINENDFSLEIKSINTIKNLTFLHIVESLIFSIINESFAFSNIAKNSIFFKTTKTLIFLNFFTIFN